MVSYSQIKEGCNIYKLTNDASINKAGNLNNGDMVQRRIPLWENKKKIFHHQYTCNLLIKYGKTLLPAVPAL